MEDPVEINDTCERPATEIQSEVAELRSKVEAMAEDISNIQKWIEGYANPLLLRTLCYAESVQRSKHEPEDNLDYRPDISLRLLPLRKK